MEKTVKWANEGFSTSSFVSLFNLGDVDSNIIMNAIEFLRDAGLNYWEYVRTVEETGEKTKHEQQYLMWADIITDFAMNIKLASGGYIDQAMRLLRGTLENVIMALFSVITWEGFSHEDPNAINPFVNTFNSLVYPALRDVTPEEIYIRGTFLNVDEEETRLIDAINDHYESIVAEILERVLPDKKKVKPDNDKLEMLKYSLARIYFDVFYKKGGKEWIKDVKDMLDPTYLINVILHDDSLSEKSCDLHEENMIERFKNYVKGKFEDSEIESMIFGFNDESITCKQPSCSKPATSYILKIRPSFKLMVHEIKRYAPEALRENLDNILKEYISEYKNFGDYIEYGLYSELNRFIHSDPREEPDILEWYSDYFIPMLLVGRIIIGTFIDTYRNENS